MRVSRAAVTQWETGVTVPDGENLYLVSLALGVSQSWLLYGTGGTPSEQIAKRLNPSDRALQLAQKFDRLPPNQQDVVYAVVNAFVKSTLGVESAEMR